MANNETLIPIPGRLHSVTADGITTGANEIFDDTLNKDQATINSEVQEALGTGGSVDEKIASAVNTEKTRAQGAESTLTTNLGNEVTRATNAETALDGRVDILEEAVGTGGSVDERITEEGAKHYLKEETYNKSELNNMITTPNQQYVSVTADSQTTSVTDVLPATGAADTTYRVGNWDGTQYNDSVFSEYAWNGSTYIKLSTKSQIGEVYDISANHADTKYADLAAALGTNGANIPQNLRKGGMSVKFVHSSDNKYVQYRLMSDTFNTTVANWQGVDDEPLLRSNNLISSGAVQASETGILNKIRELKLEVDGNAAYLVDEENLSRIGYGQGLFDIKANTTYRVHIKSDSPLGQTGVYGCIVYVKQGETNVATVVFGDQDLSIERTKDFTLTSAYQNCRFYLALNVALSTNVHLWLEETATIYDSLSNKIDILGFSENINVDVDASESVETLYGTTEIFKNDFKSGMLVRIEVLSVGTNGVSYVQVYDADNSRSIILLQNQTLQRGQVLYVKIPLDTKHISVIYAAIAGYHLQANVNLQINTQAEITNLNEHVNLLDFSENISIDVDATSSQQIIYGTAKTFNGLFKAGMLARMEVKSIGSDNNVSYVDLYDTDNDIRLILLQNQTLQVGSLVYINLPYDTHNIRIRYAAIEGHHLIANVSLEMDLQAKITKLSEEEKVTTTEYVVNPNGGGDFTSLVACFNAITDSTYYKRYKILLAEGTYDMEQEFWGSNPHTEDIGPIVPPYVSIEGQGFKENTIIKAELSDSEAVNIARVFSPLNMNNSCTLKNLTVIAKNCRYAVHAEAMAAGTEFSVINCKFHHKGTIQETGTAFAAFGLGYPSKSKFNFTGCEFQSDAVGAYPSFLCHDTANGEASILEFEACKFTSKDTANWDMYQKANRGKGGNSFIFKGCEFAHSSNSVLCGLESGSTDRTANFYAYACKNFSFDNRTGDSYTPFMVACV